MMRLCHIGLALACLLAATAPALAVDTPDTSQATPDLAAIREQIKAQDYSAAITGLKALAEAGSKDPDVYNLLGFSLRKSGDRQSAQSYYEKALELDPNHKGTLEYQGELYIENGDVPKAQQNLAALVKLCPTGCEERKDLEKAIGSAGKAK